MGRVPHGAVGVDAAPNKEAGYAHQHTLQGWEKGCSRGIWKGKGMGQEDGVKQGSQDIGGRRGGACRVRPALGCRSLFEHDGWRSCDKVGCQVRAPFALGS